MLGVHAQHTCSVDESVLILHRSTPQTQACRSDGEPFGKDDWACICEFHEYLEETHVGQEHLWCATQPRAHPLQHAYRCSMHIHAAWSEHACAPPRSRGTRSVVSCTFTAVTQCTPRPIRYTNRVEFAKWVRIFVQGRCLSATNELPCAFPEIAACFDYRFPLGLKVRIRVGDRVGGRVAVGAAGNRRCGGVSLATLRPPPSHICRA